MIPVYSDYRDSMVILYYKTDTIKCDTIKFAVNWYSSDCDCSDSSDLLKSQ